MEYHFVILVPKCLPDPRMMGSFYSVVKASWTHILLKKNWKTLGKKFSEKSNYANLPDLEGTGEDGRGETWQVLLTKLTILQNLTKAVTFISQFTEFNKTYFSCDKLTHVPILNRTIANIQICQFRITKLPIWGKNKTKQEHHSKLHRRFFFFMKNPTGRNHGASSKQYHFKRNKKKTNRSRIETY